VRNCPRASIRDIAVITAMMSIPIGTASGQAVQSFDRLQGRLQPGEEVYVRDGAGRETLGTIADISGSSLHLLVHGERRSFDEANVQQIDGLVRDGLKNGVLWGLGVGAGAGVLGMVAARSSVQLDDAGLAVAMALIVAPLAGAAVGAGIDASKTTREPVYVRSPTSGRFGASLGLSARHMGISILVGF
jgi:hypothetical protein